MPRLPPLLPPCLLMLLPPLQLLLVNHNKMLNQVTISLLGCYQWRTGTRIWPATRNFFPFSTWSIKPGFLPKKTDDSQYTLKYPKIPRKTRKYPRVKNIPDHIIQHFYPTGYLVFFPIPDPTRYWKSLSVGHWLLLDSPKPIKFTSLKLIVSF